MRLPLFGAMLVLISVTLAAAQPPTSSTTGPTPFVPPAQPDRRDALKQTQFSLLLLNATNTSYATTIDINGKRFALYDDKEEHFSTIESKPLPFQPGGNQIVVTFVPKAAGKRSTPKAHLKLLLAGAALDTTLVLMDEEIEEDFGQTVLDIQFKQTQTVKLRLKEEHWADVDHKKLILSRSAEGDGINDFDRDKTMVWTPQGAPYSETEEQRGRVVTAKCYRPDGGLGAEVRNGDGVRRRFFKNGDVSLETTYRQGLPDGEKKEFLDAGKLGKVTSFVAGLADGPCRRYDRAGTIRVSGSFKDDEMDGTWIRYDEQGKERTRSEFKAGEFIKGTDLFEDWSWTLR